MSSVQVSRNIVNQGLTFIELFSDRYYSPDWFFQKKVVKVLLTRLFSKEIKSEMRLTCKLEFDWNFIRHQALRDYKNPSVLGDGRIPIKL